MEHLFFMRRVLELLQDAGFVVRAVAFTLRAIAVLVVPFGLVAFFKAGKTLFDLPPSGILGGVAFQMAFVIAVYAVVHTLFLRARVVEQVPATGRYLFPLAAVLMRALSESLAAFTALISTGGGVYVWFTTKSVATILNPVPRFFPVFGDTTFMGGIEFIVGGVLVAIAMLLAGYIAAQMFELLALLSQRAESPAAASPGATLRPAPETPRLKAGNE